MELYAAQKGRENRRESVSAGDKRQASAQAEAARRALEDGKADNIVVLDIAARSALADYMVIAGGASARHLAALADRLTELFKQPGAPALKTEGLGSGDWVLLDAGDIIIHLFSPEARAFYRLEKMWGPDGDIEAVAEAPA